MAKAVKISSIYLDVCSLCRPFDDQRFARIRLETEAVNLILEYVRTAKINMAISPVHYEEIKATSDNIERIEIFGLFKNYGEMIKSNIAEIKKRAEHLHVSGFGVADAAHCICGSSACRFCDMRDMR